MKKSSLYLILAVASLVTAFSLYWGYHKQPEIIETRDTTIIRDTIWKDTTIVEKQLVPVEVIKKKVDTVYTNKGDTLHLVTESKMFDKRITTSQDTCDLQIYTTGINTSLDSLKWRLKTHSTHTTETVTITKYVESKKRFGIGPTVSFGYDPLRKEWGALIGVGININL
jgi:hypothetical protein